MVIVVVGMILLMGFPIFFPEQAEGINEYNQRMKSIKDRHYELLDLAKSSETCDELKTLQLELISNGADAGSWIPEIKDRALKIAKERYGVLCN